MIIRHNLAAADVGAAHNSEETRMVRHDGRGDDQLRAITIQRGFVSAAPGSVLIAADQTCVLCTASVDSFVPPWLEGQGKGWVTAEYDMLPGSTSPRRKRDRKGGVDGRTTEIQRLVGRSLRAVTDLRALGERTITIDCDVLKADGGTRTLSITGALVALVDAIRTITDLPIPGRFPLTDSVAAVSVGLVDGASLLDLAYREDVAADVDMNVVMTGSGKFIEVQGTGEEATFSEDELQRMLSRARAGIKQLTALQAATLGSDWPFAAWPDSGTIDRGPCPHSS
jgi:ribonuclease PH